MQTTHESLPTFSYPLRIQKFISHSSGERIHWHDQIEILYFTAGEGHISCNLREYPVKKGTVAVINGNYAIGAGLKIADALASEDASGVAAQTYANIVAVQKGNENTAKIKALVEALQSEKVAAYIADTYAGAVVAIK